MARASITTWRWPPSPDCPQTGEVIEFCDPEIEALQEKIARRLGYTLKGHKLELYGVPLKRGSEKT